eukprot:188742_1
MNTDPDAAPINSQIDNASFNSSSLESFNSSAHYSSSNASLIIKDKYQYLIHLIVPPFINAFDYFITTFIIDRCLFILLIMHYDIHLMALLFKHYILYFSICMMLNLIFT